LKRNQAFDFVILLFATLFFLAGNLAFGQTQSDDSADTSAAQAAIQAIQQSAAPASQTQQKFPALKAESCKSAVQYVESPSGLFGDWDRTMQKYKGDRGGLGMLEEAKKQLLTDSYWRTSTAATVATDVHTLCKLTQDVLAAMSPGGNALKTAINVSEDFGAEVSRRSVQIYQALEKGDEVVGVLKSNTDELTVWGAKEATKAAGYSRAVAIVSVLQDTAEHVKTAKEAIEYKTVVQEQLRSLDTAINKTQYDMMLQRQQLVAVEALKDAVVAACNAGQPTQAPPEFAASGADSYLPVQDTSSGEVAPTTPWWAALSSIRIPARGTTVRAAQPAQSGKSTPQNDYQSCLAAHPGDPGCCSPGSRVCK
jgi:hypothetical protein